MVRCEFGASTPSRVSTQNTLWASICSCTKKGVRDLDFPSRTKSRTLTWCAYCMDHTCSIIRPPFWHRSLAKKKGGGFIEFCTYALSLRPPTQHYKVVTGNSVAHAECRGCHKNNNYYTCSTQCCCKMIELRKYERMQVYRVRVRSSKCTHIYGLSQSRGGGRIYEIKTLCSNLAPEGGGIYSRGAYNRASTVHNNYYVFRSF